MAKTLLSMPDLRRRALAEIRQLPGCHNVQDIAINRVTDERAENNWSLCVLSAGAADANTAARAALYVQSVLRRGYDLLTPEVAGRDRRSEDGLRLTAISRPWSNVIPAT